ncbi:MAG: HD domain-containing phosphohydrolase, partial [Planctomycetota bacterium]
ALVEGVLRTLDQDARAFLNLARYEEYDAFTFGHSIRVCALAVLFARDLSSDDELVRRIGVASVLHDVGKARLPFELLHSKGVFTADERREMQKHTIFGGELLAEMEECDPMAIAVAFGHHRTEDGRGYPQTAVPLPLSAATRIVKICDVYEALTALRPYKPRVSPATAYRTMLEMEGHFEPRLLRRFIKLNGIYPTGSRVVLSSGEVAMVERQTSRPESPVVEVETTIDGEELERRQRRLVDLSLEKGASPLAVVGEAADLSRNELYTCSR